MEGYQSLSIFYESLMEDALYPQRAEYILEICRRFNHKAGKTLDLACGTGSLTRELSKLGVDVFGVDGSVEMLSQAAQISYESGVDILYVNQLMQELNLPYTVDTCVCTLDSINHLVDEQDVQNAFERVHDALNDNGLFIFDVNTLYKHREVLADNAFVLENDNVLCAWQNELLENDIIDITLDFFEEDENGQYSRYSDHILERAYSREQLEKMINNSGLKLLAVYGDLSFAEPSDTEQRAVYVVTKI